MLIIMDLDDTLLRSDKTISDYSIKMLDKLRNDGHIIVFNSLRSIDSSIDVYNLYKPDYWILFGGGVILNKDRNVIYKNPINIDVYNSILKDLIDNDVTKVSIQLLNNGFTTNDKYTSVFFEYKDINNIFDLEVYKFISTLNEDFITYICKKYHLRRYKYNNSDYSSYVKEENSKYNGIKYLLNILNITNDETICFGDDYSDIDMILNCKIGVCMENGIDEVKRISDYVCLSNDNDGVCKYLENYFYKEKGLNYEN